MTIVIVFKPFSRFGNRKFPWSKRQNKQKPNGYTSQNVFEPFNFLIDVSSSLALPTTTPFRTKNDRYSLITLFNQLTSQGTAIWTFDLIRIITYLQNDFNFSTCIYFQACGMQYPYISQMGNFSGRIFSILMRKKKDNHNLHDI